MRLALLSLALPVLAAACSFSSSNPNPPANATVVIPPGSTVVCTDGTAPPCR